MTESKTNYWHHRIVRPSVCNNYALWLSRVGVLG